MRIENRQRLLVILAAAAVALLVADKVIITPLIAGWKERADRIAELKKSIAKGVLVLQRDARIRQRWGAKRGSAVSSSAQSRPA